MPPTTDAEIARLAALCTDPDPEVRAASLGALARSGGDHTGRCIPVLTRATADTDPTARYNAAWGLRTLSPRDPAAVEALRDVLHNGSPETVSSAVSALVHFPHSERKALRPLIAPLHQVLDRATDSELRRTCVWAMNAIQAGAGSRALKANPTSFYLVEWHIPAGGTPKWLLFAHSDAEAMRAAVREELADNTAGFLVFGEALTLRVVTSTRTTWTRDLRPFVRVLLPSLPELRDGPDGSAPDLAALTPEQMDALAEDRLRPTEVAIDWNAVAAPALAGAPLCEGDSVALRLRGMRVDVRAGWTVLS